MEPFSQGKWDWCRNVGDHILGGKINIKIYNCSHGIERISWSTCQMTTPLITGIMCPVFPGCALLGLLSGPSGRDNLISTTKTRLFGKKKKKKVGGWNWREGLQRDWCQQEAGSGKSCRGEGENLEYKLTVCSVPQTCGKCRPTGLLPDKLQIIKCLQASQALIQSHPRQGGSQGGVELNGKEVAWTETGLSTAKSQAPAANMAWEKMLYHKEKQQPRTNQNNPTLFPFTKLCKKNTFLFQPKAEACAWL